jgi:hypothetical protein
MQMYYYGDRRAASKQTTDSTDEPVSHQPPATSQPRTHQPVRMRSEK